MIDLEKTSKICSPNPVELGDSEAAKLCTVLNDCKQSVEDSLQQIIKTEKIKYGKFRYQDGNSVRLGPCFKPESIDEVFKSLNECFPVDFTNGSFLNEPEKLKCDWLKYSVKPINGWTSTIDTRPWFERLSSRHNQWKKMRIYEFLKLSTYPALPFYGALTLGLLCCWNPCLNVFITGQGFKTVTLEDVAFLTGLSPTGVDLPTQDLIDGALDTEKIVVWKSKTNKSLSSIVDSYNPSKNKSLSEEISRKEEVLFINLALCKLMMFPSRNVNKTFLKLAANIEASGLDPKKTKPLRLAPLFLGQVYRCLYRLRTNENLSRSGGPIWVLSMWGLFYFPRLVEQKDDELLKNNVNKRTVLPVKDCCCYGELAIHTNSPVENLSFEEVLRELLFPMEANQSDWHPFSIEDEMDTPLKVKLRTDALGYCMKAAIPSWLSKISSMVIREGDQLHWSSILQCRDLICFESHVIGVEVYNPSLVARQFGMTQGLGIPYYKTLNRSWGTRPNLLNMAINSTENKYASTESWLKAVPTYEIKKLRIIPWLRRAEIDPAYELWWIDFLKRSQPTWLEAFAILVRNIQGPLMVSSPSPPPQVPLSAWQNKQSRGTRIPVGPHKIKVSGQFEKFGEKPTALREQKRKSESLAVANSTSPPSKRAVVEDYKDCDDHTPLKIFKRRHSTQSCQHSLMTLRSQRKNGLNPLVKDNSQSVVSQNPKNIVQDSRRVLSITSDNPRRIIIKEKKATRNIGPDIFNVSLNVLKTLEKEVLKEEATTPNLQRDASHSTQVIPEKLPDKITEEITFGTVGSEPEDSLEPPHEMVRGMGSQKFRDTSFPSMDTDNATLRQEVDHLSVSHLRTDYQPLIQEPLGGSGSSDAITSDISQAIIEYSSTSSEMLDTYEQPLIRQGSSYTPEKALADVNSLVCLIEDTLRPASTPSTFDIEKANAENILNVLQSNMENPAAYTKLADQIHRLAMVCPPKFQPNLAHFRTIFSSLQDQLQDIHKHADRPNYNPDTLQDLKTVARDLRDRIKNRREQIDKLQAECDKYDQEIEDLESKLANLRQLRASKQQELAMEQHKFNAFSMTWPVTIPSLQNQAKIMVTAKQTMAEWESILKAAKATVHSFLELLRSM